jgi:RNA polymerase sigma factor (sigma-70 family)
MQPILDFSLGRERPAFFPRKDTRMTPHPGDGAAPLIPDLSVLDLVELQTYLQNLIPLALEQLQQGFGFQFRHLRVSNEEAAAALLSAWSSFVRRSGEFADATTPTELAGQLLRIAHNRARRWHRQDHQMRAATEHATVRNADGEEAVIEQEDRRTPRPEQNALAKELATIVENIQNELRDDGDAETQRLHSDILKEWLADMKRTQTQIAEKVGTTQATVSRVINRARAAVRRCWFEENEES